MALLEDELDVDELAAAAGSSSEPQPASASATVNGRTPAAKNGRPPADHVAQLNQLVSAGRRGDAVKYFMTKMVGMPALFVVPMRLLPMWSRLEAVAHTLPYDLSLVIEHEL